MARPEQRLRVVQRQPLTGPMKMQRTTVVARRYNTVVVLDDGTTYPITGVFSCSFDALQQALASVPDGRRPVRIVPSVVDAVDTDFSTLFADTQAPDQADEAGERMARMPSPFDAHSAQADQDFPTAEAESLEHRTAAALLEADRRYLHALRDRAAPAGHDPLAHIPPPSSQLDEPRPRATTLRWPPAPAPGTTRAQPADPPMPKPPNVWIHIASRLRHDTKTRHRAVFAWSFALGLFSVLWWAGVIG